MSPLMAAYVAMLDDDIMTIRAAGQRATATGDHDLEQRAEAKVDDLLDKRLAAAR